MRLWKDGQQRNEIANEAISLPIELASAKTSASTSSGTEYREVWKGRSCPTSLGKITRFPVALHGHSPQPRHSPSPPFSLLCAWRGCLDAVNQWAHFSSSFWGAQPLGTLAGDLRSGRRWAQGVFLCHPPNGPWVDRGCFPYWQPLRLQWVFHVGLEESWSLCPPFVPLGSTELLVPEWFAVPYSFFLISSTSLWIGSS